MINEHNRDGSFRPETELIIFWCMHTKEIVKSPGKCMTK